MTIPRRMGPDSGPRRALPDFTRSASTIERMLCSLDDGPRTITQERPEGSSGHSPDAGPVRVTQSSSAARTAILRSILAAVFFIVALMPSVLVAALLLSVPEGHAPGVGIVVLVALLVPGALVLGLLALRFAILALAAARSRVERDDEGVTVIGAVGSRRVPWSEISGIDSRALHVLHGVTAALRLRRGGRVIMPLYDRPWWTYSRPSDPTIRSMRAQLDRRTGTGRAR